MNKNPIQLDLHEYGRIDALQVSYYLDAFIRIAHSEGHEQIQVVTGRGVHSPNKHSNVRHAVQKELKQHKLVSRFQESANLGSFDIWLITCYDTPYG